MNRTTPPLAAKVEVPTNVLPSTVAETTSVLSETKFPELSRTASSGWVSKAAPARATAAD